MYSHCTQENKSRGTVLLKILLLAHGRYGIKAGLLIQSLVFFFFSDWNSVWCVMNCSYGKQSGKKLHNGYFSVIMSKCKVENERTRGNFRKVLLFF